MRKIKAIIYKYVLFTEYDFWLLPGFIREYQMHMDLAKFKNVSANQIYNLMFGLSGDIIHLKHFGICFNGYIKKSISQGETQ